MPIQLKVISGRTPFESLRVRRTAGRLPGHPSHQTNGPDFRFKGIFFISVRTCELVNMEKKCGWPFTE